MRRWSWAPKSDQLTNTQTPTAAPAANSQASPPPQGGEPSSQTPPTPSLARRLLGRIGSQGSKMPATAPNPPPTQVERAPVHPPRMNNSVAVRLSKKAAVLDKRQNAHLRNPSQPLAQHDAPYMAPLPELDGISPAPAELEGDRPLPAELEGSTPDATATAVSARVIPAGTVKSVAIKAKRTSSRLFQSLRSDKTRYSVGCTNAAVEVARAKRDVREKRSFVAQVNDCRCSQGVAPLAVDEDLSAHAQHHADNMPAQSDVPSASPGLYLSLMSPFTPRPDTVTTIASPLDPRSTCARIVSDRGLGAMACVERWFSGKRRGHPHGISPEWHQEDCPCKLKVVYDTIMDAGFGRIGIGRATEGGSGPWVVELAA